MAEMRRERDSTPPAERAKVPKKEAHYRDAERGTSCAKCKHFVMPNKCAIVSGNIRPDGLSDMFEPMDAPEQSLGATSPMEVM